MTVGAENWLSAAREMLPETVALRRRIHEHPELGLHLPKTVEAVREALAGLDVTYDEGPSTSGLIVTLKGPSQGRTVLLRGDMDALPMPEDTEVPFKSKVPGAMHACGHDSHTAMLATAVKLLHARRDTLSGTVTFMFQPGEEGHFGARFMIEDGLLDRGPKPDGAFALHITPNMPTGVFGARHGSLMASTDEIFITVWGKGGHASSPMHALDPVPIACETVLALQNMVTRRVNPFDPVILTITKIEAGTATNVIPETVTLGGTLRAVSEESRQIAKEGIARVAQNVAKAHGAWAEVKLSPGYDVTINDGRMVDLAADLAREMLGPRAYFTMPSAVMGGEDWTYVLQRIPGAMLFLGVAPEGCDHGAAAPCHSNRMMLHEPAMAHGAALYAAVAERFLDYGFEKAA